MGIDMDVAIDLALKIGSVRAGEIDTTGAEIVATGCPGCRLHLTDVLRRAGSTAMVVHTVELLAGDT
jgi:glycolate oxidase iron-sulfur subunit